MPAAKPLPIVDTHQHLWDLSKFRLPWLAGAEKINRCYVMEDYYRATEGLNVVKTVYMEVDVAPEQQDAEAEYVIDLCKRKDNPMEKAVISGRPNDPGFEAYIRKYQGSPYIAGVRQVLHGGTPARYCLQPQFVRSVELLGEIGMCFDLCLRSTELLDGAELANRCPGTDFVLDHCGNANVQSKDLTQWKRDLESVADCKNVVCKVSGIIASAEPGRWQPRDLAYIINHVLDTFGPDRVMFAGDWPVCTLGATYKEWVGALKEIVADRPYEHQRKLFHDNAIRFYGLKSA